MDCRAADQSSGQVHEHQGRSRDWRLHVECVAPELSQDTGLGPALPESWAMAGAGVMIPEGHSDIQVFWSSEA